MPKEPMLREYEIILDQFPGVVIVMEYDESKRRSPSMQTSYGRAGEDIPQLAMNCPGKIKQIYVPYKTPNQTKQAFSELMRAAGGTLVYEATPPTPPPKPTPEPYEQESFS